MKNMGKFFGTQKHWVCVVVLALVCAGTVFTQARQPAQPARPAARAQAAKVKKNAISFLDAMPLVKGILASDTDADTYFVCLGLSYEGLVAPHFTIGADIDLYPGKMYDENYFYFSAAAVGRIYPMSEKIEKLFLGVNLGVNFQSIKGKVKTENGGFVGPIISLEAGYKIVFKNVFYIEPSIAYVYSKSNDFSGIADVASGIGDMMGALLGGIGGISVPTTPTAPTSLSGLSAPTPLGWQPSLRIGIVF